MNTQNKKSGRATARRKQGFGIVTLALVALCGVATVSQAALVLNGDFEADAGGGVMTDNNLRPFVASDNWTGSGNAYLYDPDNNRMSTQGGENNTAYTARSSSVRQTLGVTLENNFRYTLTLDVGNNDAFGGGVFFFPTLGDGVSTGNVFARLLANGGGSAMPGFLPGSSTVSIPAPGAFTPWTLVWQTGPSEPLAGTTLVVDLSVGGGDGTTPIEAFFDNVSLTSVPEPSSVVLLLACGGMLLARRRSS
jgi:hypothetical protein